MVKKFNKPNEARFLHDLVDRNANTRKDNTPISNIPNIINTVAKHPCRCKIDLTDGYHNVRIIPHDEKYTFFYTPFGTFRTKVIQQGDCNAPATFNKLMNWIFHDMLGRNVYIYLDDILIFDKTREDLQDCGILPQSCTKLSPYSSTIMQALSHSILIFSYCHKPETFHMFSLHHVWAIPFSLRHCYTLLP